MNIVILAYTHPQLRHITAYTPKHVAQIQKTVPNAHVSIIEGDAFLKPALSKADILIMSPLDHRDIVAFTEAPRLKWVHITSAGASELAQKLKDSDILLTNSSGVHPIPIAEHVLTFMLMFTRRLHVAYRAQLTQHQWAQEDLTQNLSELYQSTVGIVGLGRIGQRIAHVSKGFGMQVIALAHTKHNPEHPPIDKFYCGQAGFVNLLQESDFVVNCLPLTTETHGFFNSNSFQHMKSSAYFINIGRGKTVVESDLVDFLVRKKIAGAGLDVYEEEPLPASSRLWQMENVILTPHYAGWTPRYVDRVIDIFCSNLAGYVMGTAMPTLVDKHRGY